MDAHDVLKARRANLASMFLKELIVTPAPKPSMVGNSKDWSKRMVELAFLLADEFILQSEDL